MPVRGHDLLASVGEGKAGDRRGAVASGSAVRTISTEKNCEVDNAARGGISAGWVRVRWVVSVEWGVSARGVKAG